jgi:hypothetical protein
MTYAASQVGYWVGQANDNSTGVHPPSGYTPGQRWSTTSTQWQTGYNTEYANARDNSTGPHPTGWVSGQLWSTTAGQWYPMYVAEYNNARDTGAGQSSSGLGQQHPPGWGNGQFYSTTAEQWNAQWGSEWRNARDPQGYSFSYPGQGVNAVFWSQSAQYWRGQADYYWGPSRQWNNGATWEQNYNAYVGYYNDMVNQRDTWQARANSAWGASRVWSNGESWEAAYNRVLPPALSILSTGLSVGSSGTGGQWQDIAAITVNRTGYWAGMIHCYFGGGAPSPYGGFIRFRFGGTIGTQQNFNNPAPGATNYGWHTGYDGAGGAVLVSAGTVIAVQMNCNTGMGMNGNLWLVFCPTPQYPH